MEASVIPLISPVHETLSLLYEDFYTTLRVGAGSCLLPQNLLQQEGKPAPSFHTPQNPCTQAAHSEFMAPEEAAEGICLGSPDSQTDRFCWLLLLDPCSRVSLLPGILPATSQSFW